MSSSRPVFRSRWLPYLLVAPQLIITVIFFIWPAGEALWYSLQSVDPFGFSSQFVGLDNFVTLFHDSYYLDSFWTTIKFSTFVTVSGLLVSLFFAALVEYIVRGSRFYQTLMLLPYAVAPAVAAVLWIFLFNPGRGLITHFLAEFGYDWNHAQNSGQAMFLVVFASVWKQISYNFLFLCNPGTGKTEVARIMGRLLYGLGLIDRFDVVEVDRSSLVSEYVGHTPQKTNEVIETAHGGVLFVDEAYALCRRGAQNDHGREAVDTLVKALEDKRGEMAFIFAGYEAEMKSDFLDSNPGLESRFADENRFYFRDYSANELLEIFKRMVLAKGLSLDRGAEGGLQAFLEKRSSNSCFGNARDVRNTVQKLMNIHSRRWAQDKDAIPRDIITKEDVGLL